MTVRDVKCFMAGALAVIPALVLAYALDTYLVWKDTR